MDKERADRLSSSRSQMSGNDDGRLFKILGIRIESDENVSGVHPRNDSQRMSSESQRGVDHDAFFRRSEGYMLKKLIVKNRSVGMGAGCQLSR